MVKWTMVCCAVGLGLTALAGPAADASEKFYQAIRNNRLDEVKDLVKTSGTDVRDRRGTTPLMIAAAFGSIDAMKLLLDAKADVNAKNAFDATALMWSVTDLAKVRLLLDHGADVNAKSKQGRTPLLIAASSNGTLPVVKLLLAKGADLKVAIADPTTTPLAAATNANDTAVTRLLLEKGVSVKGPDGLMALLSAASFGNVELTKVLLDRGVDVNAKSPPLLGGVKNGPIELGLITALQLAVVSGSAETVKLLLAHHADVNAQDVRGMTPVMLAVAQDRAQPEVIHMLIAAGADPGAKSKLGETTFDWARKFNAPRVLKQLQLQPATFAATRSEQQTPLKQALGRSAALMESASGTFFVEGGCASCHSHNLPAAASQALRAAGFTVSDEAASRGSKEMRVAFNAAEQILLQQIPIPGGIDTMQFGMFQMVTDKMEAGWTTDALVHSIAGRQMQDGSWQFPGVIRSPIEDGNITRTALGIRALSFYAPAGLKKDYNARVAKAGYWLRKQRPLTIDDYSYQMLGLKWVGGDGAEVSKLAAALKARQNPDGGWAQTPHLWSDAYATGQALSALHECGVPATAAEYQRGTEFLLRTQLADGSWHVRSRAPKFQPYFQGGFPHDHDQWISMAATAWATTALAPAYAAAEKQVASAK